MRSLVAASELTSRKSRDELNQLDDVMNYERELLSRIDDLLSGVIAYEEFERRYYHFFVDDVPEEPRASALSSDQNGFFSSVQVKMDWTIATPDQIDKGYGWLTPGEYVAWLRGEREKYRARYGY